MSFMKDYELNEQNLSLLVTFRSHPPSWGSITQSTFNKIWLQTLNSNIKLSG
jgi:hypothetical protein